MTAKTFASLAKRLSSDLGPVVELKVPKGYYALPKKGTLVPDEVSSRLIAKMQECASDRIRAEVNRRMDEFEEKLKHGPAMDETDEPISLTQLETFVDDCKVIATFEGPHERDDYLTSHDQYFLVLISDHTSKYYGLFSHTSDKQSYYDSDTNTRMSIDYCASRELRTKILAEDFADKLATCQIARFFEDLVSANVKDISCLRDYERAVLLVKVWAKQRARNVVPLLAELAYRYAVQQEKAYQNFRASLNRRKSTGVMD